MHCVLGLWRCETARSGPLDVTALHGIDRPYLKYLAKVVLDEDAHPQTFRTAPQLYAIYCGVTEEVWEDSLTERFGALQYVWLTWLWRAAAIMQPRLARDQLDP